MKKKSQNQLIGHATLIGRILIRFFPFLICGTRIRLKIETDPRNPAFNVTVKSVCRFLNLAEGSQAAPCATAALPAAANDFADFVSRVHFQF